MTTINPEEQGDKKDKVPETEIPKETTPAPVSAVKEGDEKKDDADDEDDDRDVKPVSGKKR